MKRITLTIHILFLVLFFNAQQAELITQEKNLGLITFIKYSPDGRYIASGSAKENQIKVWDVQSGKLIGKLHGHEKTINDVAFHPDGSTLVSADEDEVIYIWDLNTWSKKDSIDYHFVVEVLSYTESGNFLVAGTKSKEIVAWPNDKFDQNPNRLGKLSGAINDIDVDGENVAACAKMGDVYVWDVETGKQIKKYKPSRREVTALDITGDYIITGDYGGEVQVAKLTDFEEVARFQAHDREITALGANFRTNVIASGGLDKKLILWDINSGKEIVDLTSTESSAELSEEVRSIQFSPDGNTFATSGYKLSLFNRVKSVENAIKIWEVKRQRVYKVLTGEVNPATTFAFHPTENVLFTVRDTLVSSWSLNSGERFAQVTLHKREKLTRKDKTEEEKEEEKEKRQLKGLDHLNSLGKGKISLDMDKMADKVKDRTIQASEKLVKNATDHKDRIYISPSGNFMVTKLDDDEIRTYEMIDFEPNYLGVVDANQKGGVNDIAMDPNDSYIALAGSGDDAITIVEPTSQDVIKKLVTKDDSKVSGFMEARAITFNQDGTRLAGVFNTGMLIIWDTRGWNEIIQIDLKGGLSSTTYLNYSKDGNHLYVKTLFGIIKVNTQTLELLDSKKVKVSGQPYMLHTPNNYIVSHERNKVSFLNLETEETNSTEPFDVKLITGVDINKSGYVGISYETGELKIFDPATGKERFIMVSEGDNAIFKTPENYYLVTKEGTELVTFRVGKDAYPFEQFDAKYNRPDIVLKAMNSEDKSLILLYEKAYKKRLQKLGLTEEQLSQELHLPQSEIQNRYEIPLVTDSRVVTFKVKAWDDKYNLKKIDVWVNDVPVFGTKGLKVSDNTFDDEVDVFLTAGKNKIQLSTTNEKGFESLKQTLEVECTAEVKRNLYLLSIGTSHYKDKRFNLNYAAKDANDIASAMKADESNLYDKVYEKVLTNEEVKKDNFKALKDFLKDATVDDQVIIFMAGHGVLDANYDYYYGTYDIDFNNPPSHGLEYSEIEEVLDGIKPIRKLLIMDTCHSGEIEEEEVEENNTEEVEGDVMFRAVGNGFVQKDEISPSKMMKELFSDLRRGTGTTVISSAGGAEFAMESSSWKNGLFTYVLLFGLRNKTADLDKDGKIMLSELQIYVTDRVTQLSHGKQVPTSRIQNIALDYQIW